MLGIDRGSASPVVPRWARHREARLKRFGWEVGSDETDLGAWEIAVVLTDHREVDYRALAENVALVFDRRGVYRRLGIQAGNVITI